MVLVVLGCRREVAAPAPPTPPPPDAVPSEEQLTSVLTVRGRWLTQLGNLVEEQQLALAFDLLGGGPCEMAETVETPIDLSFEECRWVLDRIAVGTKLTMRQRSSRAVGERRDLGIAELRRQVETTRDPKVRAALREHLEALEAARPVEELPTPVAHQQLLVERIRGVQDRLEAQDEQLEALRTRLKDSVQQPRGGGSPDSSDRD